MNLAGVDIDIPREPTAEFALFRPESLATMDTLPCRRGLCGSIAVRLIDKRAGMETSLHGTNCDVGTGKAVRGAFDLPWGDFGPTMDTRREFAHVALTEIVAGQLWHCGDNVRWAVLSPRQSKKSTR